MMASRTGSRRRANLSAHKEEIRGWVEEGYADSQIASWLGTSATSVQSFRSRHGIYRAGSGSKDRYNRPDEPVAAFEGVLEHPPLSRKSNRKPKGIWFDPSLADTEVWSRSWASVREVQVRIGESLIIIEAQRKGEGF